MTECLLIDCRGVTPEQYQGILALIPQERRESAESFRHFSDRVMSAVSGLCQEFVRIRSGFDIVRDSNGKPRCTGPYHFNISHSGLYVALSLSPYPVGVDVQTWITEPDAVRWVLSEAESAIAGTSPDAELITRIWCRKESVLKMIGTGVRLDPRSVNILDPASVPDGFSFSEETLDVGRVCVCSRDACTFTDMDLGELADSVDPRFRR